MGTIKSLLSGRKNTIALIVLAVLAVSIVVGVRLVQQQTQLKSKAAASLGGEIKFTGDNVSGAGCTASSGVCTATNRDIQLEIKNPFTVP